MRRRRGEIYQDKNSTLHDDAASVVWLRKINAMRLPRPVSLICISPVKAFRRTTNYSFIGFGEPRRTAM
jgi:hypothetical protein